MTYFTVQKYKHLNKSLKEQKYKRKQTPKKDVQYNEMLD